MRGLLIFMVAISLASGCSPECKQDLVASGVFNFKNESVDIYEELGDGLDFGTTHKIDIDRFEAGCVSKIGLDLTQGGRGCRMEFDIRNKNGAYFLGGFTFFADSFCPDFPDNTEGAYRISEVIPLEISGIPSQVEMEDGTEKEVCLEDVAYTFSGSGDLYKDGNPDAHRFTMNIVVEGDYISKGSPSATCSS